MTNMLPFRIREHGARPHQVAAHDRVRIGVKDAENHDGAVVEHVRDREPLTAKGRALLEEFEFARRVS